MVWGVKREKDCLALKVGINYQHQNLLPSSVALMPPFDVCVLCPGLLICVCCCAKVPVSSL